MSVTANIINTNIPIGTPQGGTGVASPTIHTVPIAQGASAFNFLTMADGQVLGGVTGADPQSKSLIGGNNISLIFPAGQIQIGTTTGWLTTPTLISANYTTTNNDCFISVDASVGAVTVSLDGTPGIGQTYYIKDILGNAATHNITVGGSGKTIDGAATYTISTNYGSVTLIYDGVRYGIVAKL